MSLFSNLSGNNKKKKKRSIFSELFGFFIQDIAIDLGTANTLIMHKDEIIIDEPSIVAIDRKTGEVIASGLQALMMHEKTHPNIETIRPLKDGVIADYTIAEKMIRSFIAKISEKKKFITPSYRMVICIPSGITEVERKAVKDAAEHSGAKEVYVVYEPMAAALGIGIDVAAPSGNMIVDIGGGTTEIAVISLGGIVCDESIRIAGDELNIDIKNYIRQKHNVLIGEKTAENIKKQVGSAIKLDPKRYEEDLAVKKGGKDKLTKEDKEIIELIRNTQIPEPIKVKGKDLVRGIPKEIEITHEDVVEAISKSINKIEEAVLKALEGTPAELAADIKENGIYLTGGGALLRGLDIKIRQATRIKVHVADEPLLAVVKGAGIVLKDIDEYRYLLM